MKDRISLLLIMCFLLAFLIIFQNYFDDVLRCLMDQNIENMIVQEAAEDRVASAL